MMLSETVVGDFFHLRKVRILGVVSTSIIVQIFIDNTMQGVNHLAESRYMSLALCDQSSQRMGSRLIKF